MGCSCSGDQPKTVDSTILEEVEFLMVRYDKDRDDKLSFIEAQPYMVWLNQIVHKYDEIESERDDLVKEMFKEIDTDRDNFISRDELYNHVARYHQLHYMPLQHTKQKARQMPRSPIVDQNVEIEVKFRVDEMFLGMNSRVAQTNQIFKEFDVDRDNMLSLDEAKRYFIDAENLSDMEAHKLVENLDKDKDGYLSQYDIFDHLENKSFVTQLQ